MVFGLVHQNFTLTNTDSIKDQEDPPTQRKKHHISEEVDREGDGASLRERMMRIPPQLQGVVRHFTFFFTL